MKIRDPWISMESFSNLKKIKNKVSYPKWIEYIEKNDEYFIWQEKTEIGKQRIKEFEKLSIDFRQKLMEGFDKKRAYAEFNAVKGYYEVILTFNKQFGVISTTFQKKIKPHHLRMLLDMANYLDAYLLNNGTEIIDESYITKLT